MDESREIEYLMHFGLSRQEALIYRKLLEGGKKTGYELSVIGQFYHFFGLVFGNHYYLESLRKTRRDYKRIVPVSYTHLTLPTT